MWSTHVREKVSEAAKREERERGEQAKERYLQIYDTKVEENSGTSIYHKKILDCGERRERWHKKKYLPE